MTFRDIEILTALSKYGNMSKTASELYISPSSISQVVARIEKEYGIRLFIRQGHTLSLTEKGIIVMECAKRVLGARSELEESMKNEFLGYPLLRVGATITAGTDILCSLLNDIKKTGIEFEAQVEVDNIHLLETRLLERKVDVALVEGDIRNPGIISFPVISDELVVMYGKGHPFWGKDFVSIEDVAQNPLVMWDKGSRTRSQFINELESRGLPHRVAWQCCGTSAIKAAVIAGYGVTVMSYRLAKEDLKNDTLGFSRVEGLDLTRNIFLAYNRSRQISTLLKAFIDASKNWEQLHTTQSP